MRNDRITSVVTLALLLAASPVAAKHESSACRSTAKTMKKACDNEARDEHFTTIGYCTNLADHVAMRACRDEARAALDERRVECAEQLEGRKEFCEAFGQAPYDPVIVPADFLSPAATAAAPNPYFPLVPGTVWVYEGGDDEEVTVSVTDDTKVVLGVTTIVVRDVVTRSGVLVEDTLDYFAQHEDGTVWYFGELSKSFDQHGELESLDGSFLAGVDGAKPGVIMKAVPMVGDVYRQEFALGEAEDVGRVIATSGTATTPGASCNGTCVVTEDVNLLDPGHVEHKYYAPGVGFILEVDPESGERLELVSVTP